MMTNKFNIIRLVLFSIFSICVLANVSESQVLFNLPKQDTVKRVAPIPELQNDLTAILNNPEFSNGFIGISVVSAQTGEVLFSMNDKKNFIPASNLKLLTTATALRYLGADYKFQTRMYLDGEIEENGVFIGDIYIRGYGDPSLSDYFYVEPLTILNFFINKFDSLGIKSISGNIIGDDNFFDDSYYSSGWQIDDLLYPFSAQTNALSILDNKVEIEITAGDTIGSPTTAEITPDITYIQVNNHVVTTGTDEPANIFAERNPGTNIIDVNGNLVLDSLSSVKKKISVTIDNPTLYFLNTFKTLLENNKIKIRGALIDIDDMDYLPDYTTLQNYYSYFSHSLSDIIKVVNKQSHNLASEMLLKTIARETLGYGSTANGIDQEKKFLSKTGIDIKNLSIVDGSGLSRMNLISPFDITTLLGYVYRSEYKDAFMLSLAVAGVDGTMQRRMTKTFAERRVKAKTGSMNNTSTLSGYVYTRDDEALAFSIMLMNYTVPIVQAQNLQDIICMRLATFSRTLPLIDEAKEKR